MKKSDKELKFEDYQNKVISNGQLIANWDNLYDELSDLWDQSKDYQINSPVRVLIRHYCELLRTQYKALKTLELGCGLAYLTEDLHARGFTARGTDISKSCIEKALLRNSHLDLQESPFNDV